MKNVLFLMIIFLLGACSSKEQDFQKIDYDTINLIEFKSSKPVTVEVKTALEISGSDYLLENAKKIEYIQLDDKMPLGNISKMNVVNQKIVLLSNDFLYVYDLTGKFLYHIDKKGKGHNEYLRISDFQVLPTEKEILAIDDLSGSYFYFDLETGRFLRKEKSLVNSMYACKYQGLYFSSLVSGNDFNDDETWGVVASDSTEFKYKQFLLHPLQNADLLTDNLHVCNGLLYYTPIFSDTIYTVNKNMDLFKSFVIKLKRSSCDL